MHELLLGGQRSGKSRAAEARAAAWLAQSPPHDALLLATAFPGDDEMRERIARHRADRAALGPRMVSIDVGHDLGRALRLQAQPQRLVVVDCLTLWLTQLMLPPQGPPLHERDREALVDGLLRALHDAPGPVVLVSNEIGLGVSPLSPEARRFVDALGRLHQALAACCTRVTLMVAGLPLAVKAPDKESM